MGSNDESSITAEVDSRLDDLFGDSNGKGENFENPQTESEVSDRLDELMGGDGDAAEPPPANPQPKKKEMPKTDAEEEDENDTYEDPNASVINDLKSVILSLEWEITDEVMDKLDEEIHKLEASFKDDKYVVGFLQLLDSLGKYIQKKKAESHPDSIRLLHSVYENLEKVMLSKEITEVIKRRMLVAEVKKYKALKERIISKAAAEKEEKLSEPERETEKPSRTIEERHEDEPSVLMPPFSLAGDRSQEMDEEVASRFDDDQAASEYTGDLSDVVNAIERLNNTLQTELRALREELIRWREYR